MKGTCITLAGLLALAACASGPVEADKVAAARSNVATIKGDPAIANSAPIAIRDAEQSLAAAESASQQGDRAATSHYLYLTDRSLEVARNRALAQNAIAQRQSMAQESAQARIQSLEQQLNARQTPQGTVFTLADVLFETGKAKLVAGAANRLEPLEKLLRDNPGSSVTIEGFTDSTGSATSNQALSERRAQSVKEFLVAGGIDPNRIKTMGMGEAYPIASNTTAAGRQQNRRVEVLVSQAPGAPLPSAGGG